MLLSSFAGTTIEWYDFFLFGSAAALVFPKVFFPERDPTTGTLLSFATYAVAFLVRPLGGIVFGRIGDLAGRKRALVTTLMLTGVGTFLMGCIPSYESIGIAAPILLLILRAVQGLGLGGEWGGAVTMSAEHSDAGGHGGRRGLLTSAVQLGVPVGNLAAVGALAAAESAMSGSSFLAWGWRLPFLASALLILVGLWTRLAVSESPIFEAGDRTRTPLRDVLATNKRAIVLTIGMRVASDVSYYVFAVFALSYISTTLGLPSSWGLSAVLVGSILQLFVIPASASLSDRIGRRPVYMIGAVAVGLWALVAWPLLETQALVAVIIAIAGGLAAQGIMYGPMAAFIAELFDTRHRTTGASTGYQLAAIFGGAPAPLIATLLVGHFQGTSSVAIYVIITAVVAFAAAWASSETHATPLQKANPTDQ